MGACAWELRELNFLRSYFQETSVRSLSYIFARARSGNISQIERRELNRALASVLAEEKKTGMTQWEISPSGQNHLFIKDAIFVLFSIYGAIRITEDHRYYEGELGVKNLQWMENDHLLLYEEYYIVRNLLRTCVCHYSHDGSAFVFFTDETQGV